jgi:hypothetical protein
MDARTHEAIAVATFKDMPDSFKKGAFGKALTRLQPEEWQLYTVMPDRVDGDNIVYGYFHSHKYEFDEENEQPVFITIKGQKRPKYYKGSSHPLILSYYIMIRNRHKEGDNLEVRQLGARISHYIIDGMTTIWHLWHGKLSNDVHSKSEEKIGDAIDTLLDKTQMATPGKFSQGNMFREIARRSEKFYLKWLPFALETAKSGENIAEKPKTVEMIQDVKDNLATIWHFIDAHMAKDSKMAKIAENYGIPSSKPIPPKILKKMTARERKYFV